MKALCVGELLVDLIVQPVGAVTFRGDSQPVESVLVRSGGDAANNAVDMHRLGAQVKYIGLVGEDVLGRYVLDQLAQEGVDVSAAVHSAETPQGKSLLLIGAAGGRTALQCPGTSALFGPEHVDSTLLDWADILQIGGTFHLPRFDGAGAAALLRQAKEKNIITSMDVTTDRTGRWDEIIRPCYPWLDYFLPSIEQAELIAGTSQPPEIADFFLAHGVKNVGIKLGKRGSYFKNADTAFYCGSYDVPVVETTGAGDAFVAGFMTGVGLGLAPLGCVRLGTASSAFVVQAYGSNTGMKDYETVRRFMEEQKAAGKDLEVIYD